MKISKLKNAFALLFACVASFGALSAQETPPAPSAPKAVTVPAVREAKLKNDLTVAVVERRNVPVVTVQLLVKSGAWSEPAEKAGLANLTAALLTKGTATRTASQIAEEIEALGGEIDTGAGWNNSVVNVTVMSDKLDQALAVMSDVVLNPAFKQEEIDLLKSQTLDGLTFNLKQPGFLANYVASRYSFGEHPAGGTPATIEALTRTDFEDFKKKKYLPGNAVLIFSGDVTPARAAQLAQKHFGRWAEPAPKTGKNRIVIGQSNVNQPPKETNRILVVDLPNSGQAAVNYIRPTVTGRAECYEPTKCDSNRDYYPASVFNSVLGGGYSSRLNQEIRIKRGLSYGAGSSFAWRRNSGNFGARTQTKNESAAEVAELMLAEVKRLTEAAVSDAELTPRKSVLTGNFGRSLETTEGLAAAVGELYSFDIAPGELNAYTRAVNNVTEAQIREFAKANVLGGDIIIVGDYSLFKDDLAKRFPNAKIEVIKADELDLSRETLRK